MNKTVLRSRLSREYGIVLSPQEFKNTSVAELEAMINNAQNEINNKYNNEEMVDMTNNNNNKMVTVDLGELQAIFNKAAKHTINKVNNHTTMVANKTLIHIDNKFNALEEKIDAIANSLVKPTSNPNSTTKQYNKVASTLKPIGKTLNEKGVEVNYFGVCECCGKPVTSPNVVAYCQLNNNNKIVCHTCQKKNGSVRKPSSNANPLVKKCGYCDGTRTYTSIEQMNAKTKAAREAGLKPFICLECARKFAAQKGQTPQISKPYSPETIYIPEEDSSSFVPSGINQGF